MTEEQARELRLTSILNRDGERVYVTRETAQWLDEESTRKARERVWWRRLLRWLLP